LTIGVTQVLDFRFGRVEQDVHGPPQLISSSPWFLNIIIACWSGSNCYCSSWI